LEVEMKSWNIWKDGALEQRYVLLNEDKMHTKANIIVAFRKMFLYLRLVNEIKWKFRKEVTGSNTKIKNKSSRIW